MKTRRTDRISFETAEFENYANIKIFSIGCKIAVHEPKQEEVKISPSNYGKIL
jgi:hypothetical protein